MTDRRDGNGACDCYVRRFPWRGLWQNSQFLHFEHPPVERGARPPAAAVWRVGHPVGMTCLSRSSPGCASREPAATDRSHGQRPDRRGGRVDETMESPTDDRHE
jgi:hypothetical protein